MGYKVSVVVPAYNVERYIRRCIDSLLVQSLKEIEIIIVDDGSSDSTGLIADEYAAMDARIVSVHQENKGLGFARNAGMTRASGLYVGFVDSDDWVDPEMFENLFVLAESNKADVVFSGYKVVSNDEVIRVVENPFAAKTLHSSDDLFEYRKFIFGGSPIDLKCDPVPVSVWCSLYSNKFLSSNHIFFDRAKSFEDGFFNIEVCRKAKIAVVSADTSYNYRKDGQPSITTEFSDTSVNSCLITCVDLYAYADCEANNERAEICKLHSTRTAMSLVRDCIFKILSSNLAVCQKRKLVSSLLRNDCLNQQFEKYPKSSLPLWERVVLDAMISRKYSVLHLLTCLRSFAKKII